MATIPAKLIKDGNSVAVRLPKTVLAMSGLQDDVQMEVKRGQIIIRSATTPRSGWRERMAQVIATNLKAAMNDEELIDWEITINDGLDETH